MTIGGALSELNNLLKADNIPIYYKPSIKAVMDTIVLSNSENSNKWIPVSESGYPKPEDEYKRFLTIDNKGEITIQEFLLSLDEEPQPYFTGWRNIVAYMPLPEVYKEK